MSIKVLFVDIGGVLVVNNTSAIKEKYEKEFGLKKELVGEIFKYLQTKDRTDKEIDDFLKEKGVSGEIWNKYCSELFDSESRNNALYDLLLKAKQAGKLIVYTTNNSSALGVLMEKYQIADLPDLVINSSEAGVAKPDDAFWQFAIQETQKLNPAIAPEDILVIDDSGLNCHFAIENRMKAVTYGSEVSNTELFDVIF